MRWAILALGLCVAGCAGLPPAPQAPGAPTLPAPRPSSGSLSSRAEIAANNFFDVIDRVEPVAESECRRRTIDLDCNYLIVVDDRLDAPPNAFQTRDERGRPIVGFTIALIAQAANPDELAFILGHEAAHHIEGHLTRSHASAIEGARIAGALASLSGAGEQAVLKAQYVGASLGARRYSKEFELEADSLGTVIAARAGFDPVLGAQYFNRTPDPGNSFLGTHPPNAERIATVRRIAAGL